MYLAIYILKQDLLKILKFDLPKKPSDFIYILEIRGFFNECDLFNLYSSKSWTWIKK
ncbi:hypothetical protein SAMN04487780_10764 [Bacillus thuringiensis]|nr:hypothetical protein SAMN04487780_10764 [Bacillus thuringiensis]